MTDSPELIEIDCPLCKCTDKKFLFKTHDYLLKVSNDTFALQKCLQCGCGYLSPRPTENLMNAYYPEEFYWSFEGNGLARNKEALLSARKKQLIAKEKILCELKPGSLLDIGTQKGEFIYYMQNLGWAVEGVEFTETPDKLFDVPIRYGEFLEIEFGGKKFDCITMWAVLEHVYYPAQYVSKISALLKSGGQFAGLVTNLNSIQSRWYQKDDYPRHLTIFTKQSLLKLLEKNEFHSIQVWTDQQMFGAPLSGGLVFLFKRCFGYSRSELMSEWYDKDDDLSFGAKFRGRPSLLIRLVSKIDSIILRTVEPILDRLGFGQMLLWKAMKDEE